MDPLIALLLSLACAPAPTIAMPAAPGRAPDPVVADPDAVRFVALGDTGVGNASQRLVAGVIGTVCAARGCDFAVMLGDNLYPEGLTRPDDPEMDRVFTRIYGELPLKFYAVLGNHDYGQRFDRAVASHQIAWAANNGQMVMPAAFYEFRAGAAAFYALDTDAVFWEGGADQAAWLDPALAGTDARWKVVFGHHPYVSNGQHGNAGTYEGAPGVPYTSGAAVRDFFAGHVCGRADLYLSGHEHNLQWLEACGTDFVISGAGAKTTPLVDRGNTPRFALSEEGFAWIELGADQMRVAFYDERGELRFEASTPRDGAPDAGIVETAPR